MNPEASRSTYLSFEIPLYMQTYVRVALTTSIYLFQNDIYICAKISHFHSHDCLLTTSQLLIQIKMTLTCKRRYRIFTAIENYLNR